MNRLMQWLAVAALVIAAVLFFGGLRDGQWYNLPFAVITLAVALWWASGLVGAVIVTRRES